MTQIVSSISGIEIYAPSAGNAPTNSSEVSAIASAYQVVSATSTQLYVGTAYLTGVNGAPISASRAGNAANASMANSAYYDGTGRLISALPDSAAVSSIASGYVTGVSATVANNSASWGGGGGSVVSPSGTIFVNNGNQVEGTNSAVAVAQTSMGMTSILPPQGNAIGPTGMGVLTYQHPDQSGMTLVFMMAAEYHGADATVVISGRDSQWNMASASGLIVEGDTIGNIPLGPIVSELYASSDYWVNLMYGRDLSAVKAPGYAATGVGELAWNSALAGVSATVAYNSASWGQGGVDSATVSAIASSYAESAASSKQDSSAMSAYALSSDVSGVIDTVSSNSATWGQGGVITSTGSGKVSGTGISSLNGSSIIAQSLSNAGRIMIGSGDPGMYLTGQHGTAYYKANEMIINRSGYGEQVKFNLGSAGSQVYGSASGDRGAFIQMSNDYHRAFLGALSGQDGIIELDGYSANSASMYAWDGVVDTVSSNSASWGQGGVDSATVSSIASSYAQDVSAAVSGTVDTVSSQSANWGASALQIAAGPGVNLTKSGSVLVAGIDETILYTASGSMSAGTQIVLSEACSSFERVRIDIGSTAWMNSNYYIGNCPRWEPFRMTFDQALNIFCDAADISSTDYVTWDVRRTHRYSFGTGGITHTADFSSNFAVMKVVGINRIA